MSHPADELLLRAQQRTVLGECRFNLEEKASDLTRQPLGGELRRAAAGHFGALDGRDGPGERRKSRVYRPVREQQKDQCRGDQWYPYMQGQLVQDRAPGGMPRMGLQGYLHQEVPVGDLVACDAPDEILPSSVSLETWKTAVRAS